MSTETKLDDLLAIAEGATKEHSVIISRTTQLEMHIDSLSRNFDRLAAIVEEVRNEVKVEANGGSLKSRVRALEVARASGKEMFWRWAGFAVATGALIVAIWKP